MTDPRARIVSAEQAGRGCGVDTFDLDIEVRDVQHSTRIPAALSAADPVSGAEPL
ncbi:MAG: hypothetical protein WBR13_06150 [Allosphingosinicella sp.]